MSLPTRQNTERYPTWRDVERDLKRRHRWPWRETLGVVAATAVLSSGLILGVDAYRDHMARSRAAYEHLVEGDVEARFNREYSDRITLDVRTFRTVGFRGAVDTHQVTDVSINGKERPDCVLWRTDKDDSDTWTLKCSGDPQPTKVATAQ